MLQAVIFDMDGLLFDTESAYSVIQTAMSKKRGKEFTLELKKTLMGRTGTDVMRLLNEYWGQHEQIPDLLQELDGELAETFRSSVEKLPGVDVLLSYLKENDVRMCIGTSSRKFLVDILLERFGFGSEFEFVVTGDDVERGKPDPEIYQVCLTKLGVPATASLVLEDSVHGVTAGNAAGCFTCAIPSVFTKDQDFSSATLVCESLADIKLRDFVSTT